MGLCGERKPSVATASIAVLLASSLSAPQPNPHHTPQPPPPDTFGDQVDDEIVRLSASIEKYCVTRGVYAC